MLIRRDFIKRLSALFTVPFLYQKTKNVEKPINYLVSDGYGGTHAQIWGPTEIQKDVVWTHNSIYWANHKMVVYTNDE